MLTSSTGLTSPASDEPDSNRSSKESLASSSPNSNPKLQHSLSRQILDRNANTSRGNMNQMINSAAAAREGLFIMSLLLDVTLDELRKIEKIDISGKRLGRIPNGLSLLPQVYRLHVDDNQLRTIPTAEIRSLSLLTRLGCSQNQLTGLPNDLFAHNPPIRKLYLNNNRLSGIPQSVSFLSAMTVLSLHHNHLSAFPSSLLVTALNNLAELNLYYNRLSVIPPSLSLLSGLTYLSLAHNQLSNFPADIFPSLRRLQQLILRSNKISTLPSDIGRCYAMSVLLLEDNQLTALPDSIGDLTSLKELSIGRRQSGNKITSLPFSLGQLSKLETLCCDSNPIMSPPPNLLLQGPEPVLSYLRIAKAHGTGWWRRGRVVVLGQPSTGKTSLIQALQTYGQSFTQPQSQAASTLPFTNISAAQTHISLLNHSKSESLVHISSNSTSLNPQHSQPLLSPKKSLPPTPITNTSEIQVVHGDILLQLTCVDLDIEYEYRWTLPYFLTQMSVFVLTFDVMKPLSQSDLVEWLSFLSSMVSCPRIIIVGTFMDLVPESVLFPSNDASSSESQNTSDSPALNKSGVDVNIESCFTFKLDQDIRNMVSPFEGKIHIDGPIYVSSHTKSNLSELQTFIASAVLQMGSSHCQVPLPYLKVANVVLEARKFRPIPICDVKEIADEIILHSEFNSSAVLFESILPFFQDVGLIIWSPASSLRQKVICKPEYLMQTVMKGLKTLQKNQSACGSFTKEQLIQTFDADGSGISNYIIEFLMQHHLAFFSTISDEYIIPCLLPAGLPPKHVWPLLLSTSATYHSFTTCLIRYRYLPIGLFDLVNAYFYSTMYVDQKKPTNIYFGHSHSIFFLTDAKSPTPKANYQVLIQHINTEKGILVQVRSLTEALKSWTGIQDVLQDIRKIAEVFPGLDYDEDLVCPFCISQYGSAHIGNLVPIWSLYELDEGVSCGIHSAPWKQWRSSNKLQASRFLQLSSFRLPKTPSLFWVEQNSDMKGFSVSLVCDCPESPHSIDGLSYPINDVGSFLIENQALVMTNYAYLRLMSKKLQIKLHPAGTAEQRLKSVVEIERNIHDLHLMLSEKRKTQTDIHVEDQSWENYLTESDPKLNWQSKVHSVLLSNGQLRWLCGTCSPKYHNAHPIPSSRSSFRDTILSGNLMKLGGMGKVKSKWQNRFCVIDEKSARLLYFKTEGDRKPAGDIDLRTIKSVSECESPDNTAGFVFCIPSPAKTYYFKSDAQATRAQWISSIRRVLQAEL